MKLELEFRRYWMILALFLSVYPIDRLLIKELVRWLPVNILTFMDRYLYVMILIAGFAYSRAFLPKGDREKASPPGAYLILDPVQVTRGKKKVELLDPIRFWDKSDEATPISELKILKGSHPRVFLVRKIEEVNPRK